jgi:hypothetical protein
MEAAMPMCMAAYLLARAGGIDNAWAQLVVILVGVALMTYGVVLIRVRERGSGSAPASAQEQGGFTHAHPPLKSFTMKELHEGVDPERPHCHPGGPPWPTISKATQGPDV